MGHPPLCKYVEGTLVNLISNENIVISMVCIDNKGESNLDNAKSEGHIIITRKTLTTYKLGRGWVHGEVNEF
jgi:phage I-like protein